MTEFGPLRPSGPEVTIRGGRLYWPERPAPAAAAEPFDDGPAWLERVRNNSVLIVVFLYLLLNWGFQQVRFPPVAGGGVPIGEIVLILALSTFSFPRVLGRLSQVVYLLPFMLWWGFGVGRALIDFAEHGAWALRDAVHVIESLFLLVGFVFAGYPSTLEKFFNWLPKILLAGVIYALLYPVREIMWSISPTITSGNGFQVPIIGSMASSPWLLITAAFYLIFFHGNRMLANIGAMLLIGYTVATFQMRTIYLVLIAVSGFVILYRRRAVGNLGLIAYTSVLALLLVAIVGVQFQGRLGTSFSPEFLWHHFLAIFGISSGQYEIVSAAAAGVDQRLAWWENIFARLFSDPFSALFGLGYGVVLTDFHGSSGAAVREPHNSYISIVARTGLVGATCWVLMMLSLVQRWHLCFRRCRSLGWRLGENRLGALMVYFICMWVLAIGEDAFEKPYNIIPFYFLWGIALRFSLLLSEGQIGPEAERSSHQEPYASRPSGAFVPESPDDGGTGGVPPPASRFTAPR